MTLKSDDLRVLKPSYKKCRATMVGEGGDSDTLGDDHPTVFGGKREQRFPLRDTPLQTTRLMPPKSHRVTRTAVHRSFRILNSPNYFEK